MSANLTPQTNAAGQQSVQLPAGVAVGPGRETSQTNAQGQIVQGMIFPVTLATGTMTSVFVPYTVISNIGAVQQLFNARIGSILAIEG